MTDGARGLGVLAQKRPSSGLAADPDFEGGNWSSPFCSRRCELLAPGTKDLSPQVGHLLDRYRGLANGFDSGLESRSQFSADAGAHGNARDGRRRKLRVW